MKKSIYFLLNSIFSFICAPIIAILIIFSGDPHGISQLVNVLEEQE